MGESQPGPVQPRPSSAVSTQRSLVAFGTLLLLVGAAYADSLGFLFMKMGRWAEAVVMLEQAIRQWPQWSLPHSHLGRVYALISAVPGASSARTRRGEPRTGPPSGEDVLDRTGTGDSMMANVSPHHRLAPPPLRAQWNSTMPPTP